MTTVDRVAATLVARQIPHALIGAAALAASGIARSTFDIDLLVCDTSVFQPDVWTDLRREGANVEIRRGDADDPLRGVVRIDSPPDRPVDIIVGRSAWQARAIERAHRAPAEIPVVLPRDLVLLKLYAGGSQDVWDIRELLRSDSQGGLRAQVDDDLQTLPASMRHLWEQVQRG